MNTSGSTLDAKIQEYNLHQKDSNLLYQLQSSVQVSITCYEHLIGMVPRVRSLHQSYKGNIKTEYISDQ